MDDSRDLLSASQANQQARSSLPWSASVWLLICPVSAGYTMTGRDHTQNLLVPPKSS